jgi:hypothetical protein
VLALHRPVPSACACYVSCMATVTEEPVKDPDREVPVPLVWRPVLRQVVEAIRRGDPRLAANVPSVAPVAEDVAEQILDYVADYGETLVELPEGSWDTSVVIWTESRWDVLVDLWTEAEGRSDLVLHMQVSEVGTDYRFDVGLVYVP